MKKQLAIILTSVIILTLSLSGCENFLSKPDHVEVNVMLAVHFNVVDQNYEKINSSIDGTPVIIVIRDSAGHDITFERYVVNYLCQASCYYTLTKGQSIECIVTLPNQPKDNFIHNTSSITLTWETAQANMDFSGLYNWYPHITVIMKQVSAK